jgi:hypothetical protein
MSASSFNTRGVGEEFDLRAAIALAKQAMSEGKEVYVEGWAWDDRHTPWYADAQDADHPVLHWSRSGYGPMLPDADGLFPPLMFSARPGFVQAVGAVSAACGNNRRAEVRVFDRFGQYFMKRLCVGLFLRYAPYYNAYLRDRSECGTLRSVQKAAIISGFGLASL